MMIVSGFTKYDTAKNAPTASTGSVKNPSNIWPVPLVGDATTPARARIPPRVREDKQTIKQPRGDPRSRSVASGASQRHSSRYCSGPSHLGSSSGGRLLAGCVADRKRVGEGRGVSRRV